MNDKIAKVLIFVSGVGVGAFAAFKYFKAKYEFIDQDEDNSVDSEDVRNDVIEYISVNEKVQNDVEQKQEYSKVCAGLGYSHYENNKEGGGTMVDKPYVISPEEFGDLPDYEIVSLTYYQDGILTDSWGEVIDDVDAIVGLDSLHHFGEYEDDSVFVRNDALKTDYEILMDVRCYDTRDQAPSYPSED